ncbi:ester cyclase [Actinacidiphila acididurans]|uniref:Ester cyclase n=1 Tax=Actinacidiphila acididurans TaxID=2784346 RepID=A0ABS2U1K2_9ACTN|nr:ester cyclase [Actinacidiphila acididurans]MBM9509479.1 ester cyclase [Actinacidiphila acididurans]
MSVADPTGNEALVRRFYEPLNTGDTDPVDQLLAPGWEVEPPLEAGPGPDGWKGTVAYIRGVLGDLTLTIEDVVAAGDRVAVRLVMRGTQRGELLGVPATGRQVAIRASDYHRIEGGRIVQSWHLEDFYGVLQQLNAAAGA